MSKLESRALWTRRQALKMGGGLTGGLIAATAFGGKLALADDQDKDRDKDRGDNHSGQAVPSEQERGEIEQIIHAKGQVSNGVFSIDLDRDDISDVTLRGVPIKPSFQINGSLVFQSHGNGQVMMNSDMALKAEELDPFISELIEHNIVFQAEHQHFYDFKPLVWFIHFRAAGDLSQVAKGVKAALNVTSTPFPQSPPSHPTTPLPADKMGQIIGASPSIGEGGVVQFQVPRAEPIVLGGVRVNPYLNVEAPIAFQPLSGGQAAAVPDFNLIASEINKVVGLMRQQGWDSGCLYNQETDEHPQLYFDHMFKTGDPLQLAQEIRNGLNLMNVRLQ